MIKNILKNLFVTVAILAAALELIGMDQDSGRHSKIDFNIAVEILEEIERYNKMISQIEKLISIQQPHEDEEFSIENQRLRLNLYVNDRDKLKALLKGNAANPEGLHAAWQEYQAQDPIFKMAGY